MELVANPRGHVAARRVNSVRRTSTLDTTWPDGQEGRLRIEGRCRDLMTNSELPDTREVRFDTMVAHLKWERVIQSVECERVDLTPIVGARGGGHLRGVLNAEIHEERVNGTPLYLLLDDISGVSLVSGWAWSRWEEHGGVMGGDGFEEQRMMMENVCTGFATGNSAMGDETPPDNNPQIVPLTRPDDPMSWHDLPNITSVGFRRARCIDVWIENSEINIDVVFQDSGSDPLLERVAIHEYHLSATADADSGRLKSLAATPHVLPFAECPGAIANIQLMIGTRLVEMRQRVIGTLPGVKGCTHLNDVLRSLAEVPVLAEMLRR